MNDTDLLYRTLHHSSENDLNSPKKNSKISLKKRPEFRIAAKHPDPPQKRVFGHPSRDPGGLNEYLDA